MGVKIKVRPMYGETVYENGNYKVVIKNDNFGYFLVNKLTGAIEGTVDRLPSAVAQADAADQLVFEVIHRMQEAVG